MLFNKQCIKHKNGGEQETICSLPFYYDEIRKTVKYTNESVILKNKIDVV